MSIRKIICYFGNLGACHLINHRFDMKIELYTKYHFSKIIIRLRYICTSVGAPDPLIDGRTFMLYPLSSFLISIASDVKNSSDSCSVFEYDAHSSLL